MNYILKVTKFFDEDTKEVNYLEFDEYSSFKPVFINKDKVPHEIILKLYCDEL